MENTFIELRTDELSSIDGGILLTIAIVVLGAVDIVLAGYVIGYGVTIYTA